jgi:hypothetical protein
MINSFSEYLVEEERVVYFTFGRMNPPTIGHGKLLDTLATKAGRNPYRVYLSQSTDQKKNPLSYSDKIKHARKMFPKHGRSIMINKKVKTAMDVLTSLYNEGFRKVVMVVGSDRIREFDILMKKYNGKTSRHGFYNFKSIDVISAGARDPDADGAEGMSASKQRANVVSNDFTSFAQGVPTNMSNANARRLYNDVRKGMGLKEAKDFKRHVQLNSVSETREAFVQGELFDLGEQVIIKKTDEVGTVTVLGSNYVIVETADRKTRQWLDAVEKIEESYSPQKHEEGTPAAAAHAKKMTPGEQTEEGKGLWYNIHQRRKKGLPPKKPGEKGYPKTLKIEATTAVDMAKKKIDREKSADAVKHDRALDRARLALANKKNRQTKPIGEKK